MGFCGGSYMGRLSRHPNHGLLRSGEGQDARADVVFGVRGPGVQAEVRVPPPRAEPRGYARWPMPAPARRSYRS